MSHELFKSIIFMILFKVHRAALQSRNRLLSSIFRFKRKDGEYVAFRAKAACFRNPLSKRVSQLFLITQLRRDDNLVTYNSLAFNTKNQYKDPLASKWDPTKN